MFSPSSSQACFKRAQRLQARASSTSVCLERPAVAVAPSRGRVAPTPQQQQQHTNTAELSDRQEAPATRLRVTPDATEEDVLRLEDRRRRRSHVSRVPTSSSGGSCGTLCHGGSEGDRMHPIAARPADVVSFVDLSDGTHHVVVRGRRRRRTTSSSSKGSNSISSDSLRDSSSSSSSSTVRLVVSNRKHQWSPLHSKLLQSLRDDQLLPQGARVLLGVSGGQDSMAMLRLLHDLSQQQHWPLQLVAAHCDHRVRPDSADNAAHVQRCCQDLGVPYTEAVADRAVGHWSEAGAREWRHEQLVRMAAESGCGYLALGHTATERAETVVYNMIRGAGVRGLGCMAGSRQLREGLVLVRPLLAFSRQETLQACEVTHTQVYPDTTNTDQRYMRNLLRLSVFPLLQQINPSVVHHICSTAEMLHMEAELLEDWTEGALATALVPCHLVPAAVAASTMPSQPQQQELQTHAAVKEPLYKQQEQDQLPQPRLRLRKQQQRQKEQGGPSPPARPAPAASTRSSQGWQAVLSAPPMQLPGGARHSVTKGCCLEQVFDCAELRQQQNEQTEQQQLHQQLSRQQLGHAEPPQQQGSDSEAGSSSQGCSLFLDAVDIPALLALHPALQQRVLHQWLSQQSPKGVKAAQVRSAMRLLQHGRGTGSKTSTIWGSSGVLRYQNLLMVLDDVTVRQVLVGDVRVQRVSVDGGALQEAAVEWRRRSVCTVALGTVQATAAAAPESKV